MKSIVKMLAGTTACVLALSLAACTPPTGQQMNGQNGQMNGRPNPQPDGLNGNPYANNGQQPAPYMQPNNPNGPQPQPSQWPGANNGNWQPAPPSPPNNQSPIFARSNDATPAGMKQIPSQAGKVYRVALNGQGPIPQQSRDFYMKLMPYFDAQPQVLGYMDEPSGRMAQVGFQSTKNGQPVMGMLTVSQGPNGGAVAVVMLDSPQTFQQSMQAMMAAAQQP